MKPFKTISNRRRRRNVPGFTVTEMMVTVAIFLYIFTGTWVAIQLFGMRVYTTAATKLVATAGCRKALDTIRNQIQGARMVYVGTCSSPQSSSFQLIGGTTNGLQQGNALIVYPSTSTTWYTVFYLDTSTSTNSLIQFDVTNGTTTWYTNTLAQYITNQNIFDMENWQGTIATNDGTLDNRSLIGVTMQFSQWEYPVAKVGGTNYNAYDYYQLRTRAFRRAWN
jgi:type II secretory pathway pseudopilin PulG